MVAGVSLVGKWQIVESGTWPRDHLDLCGTAYLRIDADGTGKIAFGALCASVDGRFTPSGSTSTGMVPMKVTGNGWADLRDDGSLEGEIAYDNGDETSFIAQPWPFSAAC